VTSCVPDAARLALIAPPELNFPVPTKMGSAPVTVKR
jgi:hypothetical protein